jgi:hypothetical protein
MLKLCITGGAAAKIAFPAWSALTVHVPLEMGVIVAPWVPLDVQTAGVVVVKVTANPIDDVALTVSGPWSSSRSSIGGKVIVCEPLVTVKLWATGGAAAKTASPGWEARTVHTPSMIGEITVPLVPVDEQTAGVVVLKFTPSPDDDVALTTSAGSLSVRSARGANVIVCGVVPSADPADQLTTGATSALTASAVTATATRRRLFNSPLGTPRTVPAPRRRVAAIRRRECGS